MKTIKHSITNEIKRVKNGEAEMLVKKGWTYTNKKDWKENVRDAKVSK